MGRSSIILFFILLVSCEPDELTPLDKPTEININFTTKGSEKVIDAATILSEAISSREFKQFCLNANYNESTNGYSNEEIYNLIRQDWKINVLIKESININRSMSYNRTFNRITYYSDIADAKSINRIAAILLHEYTHQLGFEHSRYGTGSVGYYFQYNFEDFLNDYK